MERLFSEALRIIDSAPQVIALPQIAALLRQFLRDPATASLIYQPGRTTLFEKIGGLTILGHHHPTSVASQPHDHGRTWAIYGVVSGKTAMYEYDLIGEGKVKLARSYWINPGDAFCFPTRAIHSHKTVDDSKLIRIEGYNLWRKENKNRGRKYELVR